MARKPARKQAPEFSEIAEQLKQVAVDLKDAFKATLDSEHSKRLQQKASDAFDDFVKSADKLGEDAKSGKLEHDLRNGLSDALKALDKKLKDYSRSAKQVD